MPERRRQITDKGREGGAIHLAHGRLGLVAALGDGPGTAFWGTRRGFQTRGYCADR